MEKLKNAVEAAENEIAAMNQNTPEGDRTPAHRVLVPLVTAIREVLILATPPAHVQPPQQQPQQPPVPPVIEATAE